jgi:hypothetical protein
LVVSDAIDFPEPGQQQTTIDARLFCGYNTRSIHEDAEQALSAAAEGHWRTE